VLPNWWIALAFFPGQELEFFVQVLPALLV